MSVLPGAAPVDQFPAVAQVTEAALLFQSFVVCALVTPGRSARRRRAKRMKLES